MMKASRSRTSHSKSSNVKTSPAKTSRAGLSRSQLSHVRLKHPKPSRHTSSRHRQLEFQGQGLTKPGDEFGGSLLKGHPKKARPLDSKLPVHLTLRARKSVLRLPKFFGKVQDVMTQVSRKHGVKIYKQANVGNHLHFVLKLPRKTVWAGFIRELTGRIALVCRKKASQRKRARARALEVTARSAQGSDLIHNDLVHEDPARASENRARLPEGRFWMVRPHTRLVRGWKKAFKIVLDYIHLNQLEAEGRIARKDIKTLKEYRQLFVQGFVIRSTRFLEEPKK